MDSPTQNPSDHLNFQGYTTGGHAPVPEVGSEGKEQQYTAV